MSRKQSTKASERVIVNEEVIDVVALRAEVKRAGMRFWVLLVLISLLSSLVVPYLSMASVVANDSAVFDGDVIPGYSMGGIDIPSYGVDLNSWAKPAKQTNSSPAIVQSQYGYWTTERAKNAAQNLTDSQKKDKDAENAALQGYEVKDEILNGDEKARGWIGITRDKGEGTGLTNFSSAPAGEQAADRKTYNESVAPYRTQADCTFWDSQTIGGTSPSVTTTIYPDFVIVGWDKENKRAQVLTNPDSIQNMTNSTGGATSGALAGTSAVPHYVPLSTLFKEFKLSDTVMGSDGMVNLDTLLDAIAAEAKSHDGQSPTLNKIAENASNNADYDLLLGTHYDNLNGENKSQEKGSDAWNPYPYSMVFKMATDNGTVVSSIYNNNEAYVYFSPQSAYTNYLALRSEYDALVNNNATLVADKDPAVTFQLGYYLAGMSILEAYLNETLPQDMTRGYVGPSEGNPLAAAGTPLADSKKLDTRSGNDQTVAKLFKQSLSTVDQMVTQKMSTATQEASKGDDASKKTQESNPNADVGKLGFKSVAYSQLMYDFADAAIAKYGQSGKNTRLGATSAIMNTLSTYGYGTNDTGLLTNGQTSAGQGPNRGMTRRQNMARMTSFGPYGSGAESLAVTIDKDDADPMIKPDVANNANTGMYVPVYYPIQQHVMPVDPEMTYRFQILSLIPYNTLAYELGKHGFNNGVTLSYANNALNSLQSNKNYYNKSAVLARQFDDLDEQGGSLGMYDTGQSIVLNPQTNMTSMVGDKTTQEYAQDKTLTERVDNALRSFTTNLMNSDNVHDLVDIVRAVPGVKYETFVRCFNPIKSSGGATDIFLTRVTPAQTTYMPAILTKGYESAGGVTNSTNAPSTTAANFDYFSIPSFAPCFAAHTADDTYYGSLNYELRPFYTSDFLSSLPADANIPALEQWEESVEKKSETDDKTAIKGMKEKVVTVYVLSKRLAFSTAYGALTMAQDGKEGTVTLGSLYHASNKLADISPASDTVKKALTPKNLKAYIGPETDNGLTGLKENLVEGELPEENSGSGTTEDAGDGGSMDENAKKIWQVFSYWGLSDEEVAGVLSNFETECAIDPTGIEACYDDEYGMGGRKAAMAGNDEAAKDAMSSWTQNEMRSAYAASGISLAWDFYGPGSDGRFYPGIGICSWTGYSQVPQILDKAREMGKKWWDMDFQTAYLLVDPNNSPPGEALWEKMKSECSGKSAYDCAFWFYTTVEMPGNCGPSGWDHLHCQHADKWLGMIKGWSKDESYAKKIIDMAHKISGSSSSGSGSATRSSAAGTDEVQTTKGSATTTKSKTTNTKDKTPTAQDIRAAKGAAYASGQTGNADAIYESEDLANHGYVKATDDQWKSIAGKHLVGDIIAFHIPKGIKFKAGGEFAYAMQEFGQKHIIPNDVLGQKVVWCKDSNGYAFVTSVSTIFAALYKDTYNRYLAPNGEYYWDKAETISGYEAQPEVNSLSGELTHYGTVALEYSKATDAATAKRTLNEYCETAFADASKYLPNRNVINDDLPPQMQNVLAWADTQTSSESEGNYISDPSTANDTFIEITGKEDETGAAGAPIHSFSDLQAAGFIVITNKGAWAAIPNTAAAAVATGTRSNAIQSRMKRGVAGTASTASETLAAYTITATVGRIDRLVSTQSSKSSIPYSGICSGNLNSGAEQYSLLQAHSIDRQSISSGLAGDLRKRDSANALVSLNNPQSTPETQAYVKSTSAVTNELLSSAIPGSVDMVVNAMETQTSTDDTTSKTLKGTSAQSHAGTVLGTDKTTQTLALASTFDDTPMNRESAAAQTFNTANRTMTSSGASATASALGSVSENRKLAESLVNGAFSDAYSVIQSIALIMVLAFLMIIAFQNFIAYSNGKENDYIMAQTKLKTVLPRTLIAVAMIGLPPLGGGVGFQGGCFLLLQIVNSVMDAVLGVLTQGNDITSVLREIGLTFITDINIFDIAGTVLNLVAALIFIACSAVIMLLVFLTDIVLFLFWAIGPIAWAFYVWPYGGAERSQLAEGHGLKKVLGTLTGKMGSKVFMNGEIGRDAPTGWLMGYIMTLSTTVKWVFLYWGVGIAFNILNGKSGVNGIVNTIRTAGAADLDPSADINGIDVGGLVRGTGASIFTGIFGNLLLALLFALVTYMTFRTFKNSMGGAIGAMYGMVGDITSTIAKTAGTGLLGGLGGVADKAKFAAAGLKESNNPLKKLAGTALDSKPVQFGLQKTGDIARATEAIANNPGASDMMNRVNKLTDNLAKDADERATSSGAFDNLITVSTEKEEYVDEDGKTRVRTRQVAQLTPALQLSDQLTRAAVGAQYRQLATATGMTALAMRAVSIAHDPEFRALQQQEALVDMLGSAGTGLGTSVTSRALNLISGRGGSALTQTETHAVGDCLRSYRDDYLNRDANAKRLDQLRKKNADDLTADDKKAMGRLKQSISRADKLSGMLGTTDKALDARLRGVDGADRKKVLDGDIKKLERTLQAKGSSERFADLAKRKEEIRNKHYEKESALKALTESLSNQSPEMAAQMRTVIAKSMTATENHESLGVAMVAAAGPTAARQTWTTVKGTGFSDFTDAVIEAGRNDSLGTHRGKRQMAVATAQKKESVRTLGEMNQTLKLVDDEIAQHYQDSGKAASRERLSGARGRSMERRMQEANPELARSQMSPEELSQEADALEKGKQAKQEALRRKYEQKVETLQQEAAEEHATLDRAYEKTKSNLIRTNENLQQAHRARLGNGVPPAPEVRNATLDATTQQLISERKERRDRLHAAVDRGAERAQEMAREDFENRSASIDVEAQLAHRQAEYTDKERAKWQSEERSEAHATMILDASKGKPKKAEP